MLHRRHFTNLLLQRDLFPKSPREGKLADLYAFVLTDINGLGFFIEGLFFFSSCGVSTDKRLCQGRNPDTCTGMLVSLVVELSVGSVDENHL